MARASREQILSAVADGAELTEAEILESVVDVSENHVLAMIQHMANSGAIVAIKREASGELPEATLYRRPSSGEQPVDHFPEVRKKITQPKKPAAAGTDRSLSRVEGPDPLDAMAAILSTDEYWAFLRHCVMEAMFSRSVSTSALPRGYALGKLNGTEIEGLANLRRAQRVLGRLVEAIETYEACQSPLPANQDDRQDCVVRIQGAAVAS